MPENASNFLQKMPKKTKSKMPGHRLELKMVAEPRTADQRASGHAWRWALGTPQVALRPINAGVLPDEEVGRTDPPQWCADLLAGGAGGRGRGGQPGETTIWSSHI